jgi:hypothetical protein
LINFNGAVVIHTQRQNGETGHNGKKVGEMKETELLTFATIRGAGHLMSIFSFSLLN